MEAVKNAFNTAREFVLAEYALANKPLLAVIFAVGCVAGCVAG